ncbi:MAG: DUF177 domain-containing protein [Gemmatimonadota bacterium]
MLAVDLGYLARSGGLEIAEELEAGGDEWSGADATLSGPLAVHLEVRSAAGDVIARGRLAGTVAGECRRCLRPVRQLVDEPVTLVFRQQGGDADTYPLPDRGATLDLWPAVREQWLLAVPAFLECEAGCKGLCPLCGVDLNERQCGCVTSERDARWGPLRALARAGRGEAKDEVGDGRSEEEDIEAEKA